MKKTYTVKFNNDTREFRYFRSAVNCMFNYGKGATLYEVEGDKATKIWTIGEKRNEQSRAREN